MNASRPMVRCREITADDIDAIADLLTRGFYGRSRSYWLGGLQRQAERDVPAGYPRYGYMLDHAGKPAGVLLLIYSAVDVDGVTDIRCNLSSWYVDPAFRNYAPMLTKIAQRHKEVSYKNISPAKWTWPIIEAQGFRCYCTGLFFSLPALSLRGFGTSVEIVGPDATDVPGLAPNEVARLTRHARAGCLSLVCRTKGRTLPFILQAMRIRRGLVSPPAMQLIYCRDLEDYVACAGPIGRFLLGRGKISVIVDANGPVPGLLGLFTEARGRKYFKGPHQPQLGDLSDTELVLYGP